MPEASRWVACAIEVIPVESPLSTIEEVEYRE
jgi:hypothetical protein